MSVALAGTHDRAGTPRRPGRRAGRSAAWAARAGDRARRARACRRAPEPRWTSHQPSRACPAFFRRRRSTIGRPWAAPMRRLPCTFSTPGLGLDARPLPPKVLLPSDLLARATDITPPQRARRIPRSSAVARDAYAIGITAQLRRAGPPAGPCARQGSCGFSAEAPMSQTPCGAEDYPLTAPVYLYLAPRRLPQLVRAVPGLHRNRRRRTARRRRPAIVNQSLTRTDFAMQGVRLANAIATAGGEVDLVDLQEMVAVLSGAERLSATFRFAEGSTDLDPQSSAAAARLAAAIERGVFDGRRLLFVGFSDGAGRAEVNERLSLRRAETVRNAVAAQAAGDLSRVEIESIAFGEAMPMSCDETEWGRSVNRRVEVWVR
jgi:outer membrane protein OmpA-like peptidoglycan-associated protein